MPKLLIGLVIGLILGGVITFFTFVGVPKASKSPGTPIAPPDGNTPSSSARIVLGQDLFNQVLTTIFKEIKEPAFQMGKNNDPSEASYEHAAFQEGAACDGIIRILAEGSGVRSGLKLEEGRISAPLAFAGTYNSPFGCLRFTGWTQANLELRFDKERQAVYGRVDVGTVNLDGVNPLFSALITPLVQSTINDRVNPIQIINPGQLAVDLPIASTGGKLQAVVEDVRAEVKENAINLYVVYNFHGSPTT
jgi:hypothetical protein